MCGAGGGRGVVAGFGFLVCEGRLLGGVGEGWGRRGGGDWNGGGVRRRGFGWSSVLVGVRGRGLAMFRVGWSGGVGVVVGSMVRVLVLCLVVCE